jgi:hypothetical protein
VLPSSICLPSDLPSTGQVWFFDLVPSIYVSVGHEKWVVHKKVPKVPKRALRVLRFFEFSQVFSRTLTSPLHLQQSLKKQIDVAQIINNIYFKYSVVTFSLIFPAKNSRKNIFLQFKTNYCCQTNFFLRCNTIFSNNSSSTKIILYC